MLGVWTNEAVQWADLYPIFFMWLFHMRIFFKFFPCINSCPRLFSLRAVYVAENVSFLDEQDMLAPFFGAPLFINELNVFVS